MVEILKEYFGVEDLMEDEEVNHPARDSPKKLDERERVWKFMKGWWMNPRSRLIPL